MPSGGATRRLRAGPLEATWDDGGLRWIAFDGVEVLRGILLTARDADWRTLAPAITGLHLGTDADRFSIAFDTRWAGDRFAVDGRVSFEGDRTGRIDARFTAFEATHETGAASGVFPVMVTADRFMTETRAMRWDPADDVRALLAFEGDPWETEDQRAWTDASFKSYAPPLAWPHPVTLQAGATKAVGVRLEVARIGTSSERAGGRGRATSLHVTVHDDAVGPLPPVGLGWSAPLEPGEAARLRSLHPAHLRVVVDRTRDDWRPELHRAAQDAAAVGTGLQLELVGFADGLARDELVEALGEWPVPIVGALVFGTADDAGLTTSDGSTAGAMRDRLRAFAPGIQVGGGSRAHYAELAAASATALRSLDTISFAVSPQVHAADAATVMENVATLPVLMESAAVLGQGRLLDVSCSFRPRFGAYATPPERRLAPTRYDDRIETDLGSAWMVGTLAGVLTGHADRVTILEASGPAGVLRSDALIGIFEAVVSMRTGQLLRVDPVDGCAALAIRTEDRLRVIVANLHAESSTIRLALPTSWRALEDATDGFVLAPLAHRALDAAPD